MQAGEVLEIAASDSQAPKDFSDLCESMGHGLLRNDEVDGTYIIVIQKGT